MKHGFTLSQCLGLYANIRTGQQLIIVNAEVRKGFSSDAFIHGSKYKPSDYQ